MAKGNIFINNGGPLVYFGFPLIIAYEIILLTGNGGRYWLVGLCGILLIVLGIWLSELYWKVNPELVEEKDDPSKNNFAQNLVVHYVAISFLAIPMLAIANIVYWSSVFFKSI